MHAKHKVSISYGSKVIANVKIDNRQTSQKEYAPINRFGTQKNKNCSEYNKFNTCYTKCLKHMLRLRPDFASNQQQLSSYFSLLEYTDSLTLSTKL